MPARIKNRQRRLAVGRLFLPMFKEIAAAFLDTDMFGSAAGDLMLFGAIYIGQAEGKPMTIGKLANYAGMPRSTVIRKVRTFSEHGLLLIENGRVTIPIDHLNDARVVRAVELSARRIQATAAELSKLDT